MENIYDLIIVGLGPAGIKAAQNAIKNGLKTLAFEENCTGGTCLNKGCVPTKAIMHSSEIFNEIKNCDKSGIKVESEISLDFAQIIQNKNSIVQKLNKASENALIKAGLEIINEHAVIDFENLKVNGIKAHNIIVATGSIPYELPFMPFNGVDVLSSDDILNLERLPKSIGIIGSGAIGVEWARILSNFNVEVTLIEKAPSLLPLMDIDIQKRITRILKMKKVKIITGLGAKSFGDGILTLEDDSKIEVEKILVAIGRKKLLPEGLIVNPDLTTNYKNVYAAGDLTGVKMLAHTASAQSKTVIDKISGKNSITPNELEIPSVIYGSPEIASIGVNEQDMPEGSKIYNLPISYLAKSWCDNNIDGFIKIITKDDFITGAHIVSNEASSLITQIQIMMKTNFKVQNIEDIIFAHPTYSEGIYEAILNG